MGGINGIVYGSTQSTMERFGTGAKIGNIRLPDFIKKAGMYTKTEPSKSDEELKEIISKVAREDAKNGTFQNADKEFLSLKKEYISSASPDRESIVTNSMKQIDSIKQMFTKTNSHKSATTLLELFIGMEKGNNKTIVNGNGNGFGKLYMEGDKLNNVEFYGSGGEIIATYDSNTGWSCIPTKEETARLHEFCSIYNEAWNDANAGIQRSKRKQAKKPC